MQIDSDLVIYRNTLVRTFQVVTICRVDKSEIDSDLVIYRNTLVRTFQVVTICRVDKSEVLVVLISPHDSKHITLHKTPTPKPRLERRPSSSPKSAAASAAAARFRRKIVSGQFDEENPFMLISSVLLVQADEGVSFLVMDRIGDIYRNLPRRADVIVTTVGATHKCQQDQDGRNIIAHRPPDDAARCGATTSAIARAGRALVARTTGGAFAPFALHGRRAAQASRRWLRALACGVARCRRVFVVVEPRPAAAPASLRRCHDGWSEFF
ncbi:hypothetical protein F511_40036 [Dorcoceras hygrometricum]|uniref:Uncharacterized protein n=1 Tax=Dorcoceras hygrometricum TaxID=472368 RepID=A0A2Z7BVL1_9LAMI|nr:hypothetical protein F511_40036 [Dorcoceras hygrometricum]